jgi:hypothetical protein
MKLPRSLLKFFGLLSSVLLLSACQQKNIDYAYLMTHPKALRQQLDQCDNHPEPKCQMIHKAGVDFSVLINDRGVDPQGFGKKILAAQTKLSELEAAYHADLASGSQAKITYETQLQAVNVLLAVVAATSSVSNS